MEFTSKEKFEEAEKIEKLRNKVLKYILYKKRTETEVRQKFIDEDENMLEDVIEYLKGQNYINDKEYIERAVKEFIALKKMSIKEMVYKISQKGVSKSLIDEYICENKETIVKYEISSAKAIILKKIQSQEENVIRDYLYKKGYMRRMCKYSI
ncbi:MAG TPA: RecX family transcriptional regulator [Candidatus Scatovivens faecipullorum]|nr:RecX family transcriptional regulator [Candidatus Scatovivens faecipullorum]